MTERVLIFIIIASAIVAVTLILGIVTIAKSICDATQAKASAVSLALIKELKEVLPDPNEVIE